MSESVSEEVSKSGGSDSSSKPDLPKKKETSSITITFDLMFEILRNERSKEDLMELPKDFYKQASLFIKSKNDSIENTKEQKSLMSNEEIMHKRLVLSNIKKVLTEIYERREKKIINLALNKSRTRSNVIDTSSLLVEERTLFEDLVKIFDTNKANILTKIIHGQDVSSIKSFVSGMPTSSVPGKDTIPRSHPSDHSQGSSSRREEQYDSSSSAEEDQTEYDGKKATMTVRFLQSVPKFLGKELEVYGPFTEDDMANLPREIAEVLIKKGRAEELL